jgi:aryl-alcohol dehydrogenase-like predicted oxidoreductase
MAQLALAWCLTNPDVSTVITGATSEAQVRENLGAAEVRERLTPEVLADIDAIVGPEGD